MPSCLNVSSCMFRTGSEQDPADPKHTCWLPQVWTSAKRFGSRWTRENQETCSKKLNLLVLAQSDVPGKWTNYENINIRQCWAVSFVSTVKTNVTISFRGNIFVAQRVWRAGFQSPWMYLSQVSTSWTANAWKGPIQRISSLQLDAESTDRIYSYRYYLYKSYSTCQIHLYKF